MEVIPVMYFSPAEPDYPEQTVAAVTVNKNGAKLIAFYMAFGIYLKIKIILLLDFKRVSYIGCFKKFLF